ncbi:MAG: hypothetical protein GQ570_03590 [Helicobacteraceae bacterium]|nr:hypothetical protein [Helicobacteraceae bacterium]
MKIVMLDPKKLVPYKNNAKVHTEHQIEELAKIIARDGFDQPVVVDKDHIIIKGHGRVQASLKLELDEIPVIVRDDLSPADAALSRMVDNESVDTEWDAIALELELNGISELGGDIADTLLDDIDFSTLGDGTLQNAIATKSAIDETEVTHKCESCGYEW